MLIRNPLEIEMINDATAFFDLNLKNHTEFSDYDLSNRFLVWMTNYERHAKYFDDRQQQIYRCFLSNTYWKCAKRPKYYRYHLPILERSDFFKITWYKIYNTPVLQYAIKNCKDKPSKFQLKTLLKNKEIQGILNDQDSRTKRLPANSAPNKDVMQLLVDKGAKNNCTYEEIKKLKDKNHLQLMIRSHIDINQIDHNGKNLIEQAFDDKNESLLTLLKNEDVNIDLLLKKTGKSTFEELILYVNAENYYEANQKGFDKFSQREFQDKKANFVHLVNVYDQKVKYLDEKKQQHYTTLLLNSFWECKNDTDITDHLSALVNSPFFKIAEMKTDNKPILYAAIDCCLQTKNDIPLRALLEHKAINEILNTAALDGEYPVERAWKDQKTLQLLLEKGAKHHCAYTMIRVANIDDVDLILNSHDDLNSIAKVASEKKDSHLLIKLQKLNPQLSELKDIDFVSIKKNLAKEFCEYYRTEKEPLKFIPQVLLREEKDFKKLIEEYDSHIIFLEEKERQIYADLLADACLHFVKNYSRAHLEILMESPYFQLEKVFHSVLEACEQNPVLNRQSIFVLLEHKDIAKVINERGSDHRLPMTVAMMETNLVLGFIKKGGKNDYDYNTLSFILNKKPEYFQSIVQSHIDISVISKAAILEADYPFLMELKKIFLFYGDFSAELNIDLESIKHEYDAKIAKTFCANYCTSPSLRFHEDVLKKDKTNFKNYITQYESQVALLSGKDKEIYSDLLTDAYLYFIKSQCVDHIETLVSSPYFKLEKALQPVLELFRDRKYKIHRPFSLGLLAHKDIDTIIRQPISGNLLVTDFLKYDRITLLSFLKKGAKHNFPYSVLKYNIDLPILVSSLENVNMINKNGLTLVEQAILDRSSLLVTLYRQGATQIERILATGGLNLINELLTHDLSDCVDLIEKLNYYKTHVIQLRFYLFTVLTDILTEKFSKNALQQMVKKNCKFKNILLSFIEILPKEIQSYIFSESFVEDSLLYILWNTQRSLIPVTIDSGVLEKVKHLSDQFVNFEALSRSEVIEALKDLQLKFHNESSFMTSENNIVTNSMTKYKTYQRDQLSDTELAILKSNFIDTFEIYKKHIELKGEEKTKAWGYTFALADFHQMLRFKKFLNKMQSKGVKLGQILDAMLIEEKQTRLCFKKLVENIYHEKIAPGMLKEICLNFPAFPARLLDFFANKEEEFELLQNVHKTSNPFYLIFANERMQTKIEHRLLVLRKKLNQELAIDPKKKKIIDLFQQQLRQYERHLNTADLNESPRLTAKKNICLFYLDLFKNNESTDSYTKEYWQNMYPGLNIFKKRGMLGSMFNNNLASAIDLVNREAPMLERPPAFAPPIPSADISFVPASVDIENEKMEVAPSSFPLFEPAKQNTISQFFRTPSEKKTEPTKVQPVLIIS